MRRPYPTTGKAHGQIIACSEVRDTGTTTFYHARLTVERDEPNNRFLLWLEDAYDSCAWSYHTRRAALKAYTETVEKMAADPASLVGQRQHVWDVSDVPTVYTNHPHL